jgi:hypothetical protein
MSDWLLRWWWLAEHVAAWLATPRDDPGATDRRAERVLASSWLWSGGERIVRPILSSWSDSACRRWTTAALRWWWLADRPVRLRAVGATLMVAAATTVIAQTIGAGTRDTTALLLPAAVGAAGAVLSWHAERTPRATAQRRS